METFKCDKCGAYIDNVSQKRLVKMIGMERYEFAQKTKTVELCPNCWVELEDYLGIEVETPKETVSHEPDLRYRQREWIPCTERHPEEGVMVMTTGSDGKLGYLNKIVDGIWVYKGNPIAWMPLPEPYEEVEE